MDDVKRLLKVKAMPPRVGWVNSYPLLKKILYTPLAYR